MTAITKMGLVCLEDLRPRKASGNARLGDRGQRVTPPVARITTTDGATGFG